MNNCLFIPMLTGLFTAIFGYFLGKVNSSGNDEKYVKLINDYKKKNEELNNELNTEKAKVAELADANNKLEGTLFANAKNEQVLKSHVAEMEEKIATSGKNNDQHFKMKIAELEQKLNQLASAINNSNNQKR